MIRTLLLLVISLSAASIAAAQARQPSTPVKSVVVITKQALSGIADALEKQAGNKNEDVVTAAGNQMRVAVFHDDNRVNDLVEVHDNSDDIYYVLDGTATLLLGGSLVEPNETAPGEWRAKSSNGGKSYTVKKGDLIVVPRGTPHQRTVTDKGFSMILVKVFDRHQPAN